MSRFGWICLSNRTHAHGQECDCPETAYRLGGSAQEIIAYLRSKIDPRDAHNPIYALLHRQIDAIVAAETYRLRAAETQLAGQEQK